MQPGHRPQRIAPRERRRRAGRRHTPLFVEHLEARTLLAAAPAGLLSWYRAEGDALDSAGSHDGVLENGATFTAGKVGQAFLFDGLDDQVRIADDDSQDPGSGFTVEAWVNLSESGHGRTIAQKRSSPANLGGYTLETSHDVGTNGLQFVVWLGGTAKFLQTPAGVLTNGAWQHVAATYSGMSMRIFVDGVEKASDSASGTIDNSDDDVIIGRNAVIGSFAWKGAIDEWSFYNRALTQAEVQGIVSAGSAGKSAAIVVTTAADEDDGSPDPAQGSGTSLREAINRANANPGDDDIHFNIPGAGPHTIAPASALPKITDAVMINGYTQPGASPNTLADGNDAVILIELDGTSAGDGASGLMVVGGGSTIRGLAINRFSASGIVLLSDDNVIEGNFLGTDVTGTQDRGNNEEGVEIVGQEEVDAFYTNAFEGDIGEEWSTGNTDVTPADGSRFLGQFGSETVTLGFEADSIDQDIDAMTVSFDLYVIRTWDGNHDGGGSGPDRFSLTLGNGMSLLDTTFSNGYPNSASAGQAYPGVFGTGQFDSRTGAAENNTLGYLFPGVDMIPTAMDSVYHLSFTFSYTGSDLVLNFTGALTTPGDDESWGLDNVELIGHTSAASAPNDFSLASNPSGDWTYGWTSTLGGTLHPYPTAFTANGIEGWIDNAIQQFGTPAVVYNPTAVPISTCCAIQPGQINFHPGPNGEQSVVRWTAPADELVDVAAFFVGIDGSPTTTDAHVLHNGASLFSGFVNRLYAGPYFETTLAVQAGDTIDFVVGVGGNGFISDSTALDAVITKATIGAKAGNRIGGTSPAEQNIVAFNRGDGIRTDGDGIEVVIVGNSIFENVADGIDLDDEIVEEPEIVSLTSHPSELTVHGVLDAEPSTTYRIEMFASVGTEVNEVEGQRLLGVRQVTTDASGHIAFIHELPPVVGGQWITATATLLDGDGETLLATSEFSEAMEVNATAGADLAVTITDIPDPVFLGESVAYTVQVTNHGPSAATGVIVVASGPVGQPFNSVTIPIGGLQSGASNSFQLVFTPTALGTFSATATVMASEGDPNPANNSFTETTLVKSGVTFELEQAQYEVREGEEFAVLKVRRSGSLTSSVSVDFETVNGTAGQRGIGGGLSRIADFTTTSGTLFFRSRSNVATIRVPIGDDTLREPDESFRVVLSNPSGDAELGPQSSATVVIHDNDPTLSFLAASSQRGEAVGGRASIEVRLSPASNQTVTVNYAAGAGGSATPGADYFLIGRSLTFRPGETRKFIQFSNVNDTLYEGNETAFIELSSPTNAFLGAQARHRVTIVDNDPQPPPVEPGSTPDTALFIDLQTLPRQSFRDILIRSNSFADKDTFRVHLDAGERLALDVDPSPFGGDVFSIPGIGASTLVVLAPDPANPGQFIELTRVGRSAEPDTGVQTNNPATLFTATAEGDYYFRLELPANAFAGYRLHFHRLGVSENVPSPEQLIVPGPMYAWVENTATASVKTVGITGPTGYGFTLKGPWLQVVNGSGRSALKSQTLTLPAGSRFTLTSPQLGVDLPLIANGPIVVKTNSQRWGDSFGVVSTSAINFPVAIDIVPLNNLLASTFGSQFVTAGLLSGEWRISLGGSAFNLVSGLGKGIEATEAVDQLLPGVPYLRRFSHSLVDANVGGFNVSQLSQPTPVNWIFDPADPMLFVKIPSGPGVAVSTNALLRFRPQDPPDGSVDAGFTEFTGHVYANATIPLPVPGFPMSIGADVVINIDADRDGRPLGDIADVRELAALLAGDPFELREVLRDIQIGANGRLNVSAPAESPIVQALLTLELGRASVVLNGLAETVWLRGEFQGRAFGGTSVELVDSSVIMEGLIDFGTNDFLYIQRVTSNSTGIGLGYEFRISNDGVSLRVFGGEKWSVKIDRNGAKVSGTAAVSFEALVAIEIDDNGDVHLAGSVSASGTLKARIGGETVTLFSDSVEANVRSRGLRFRFPRGVGNLDLDLF